MRNHRIRKCAGSWLPGRHVLVEVAEFAADAVDAHGLLGAVSSHDHASVGHVAVAVGITGAPVDEVFAKCVLACQLGHGAKLGRGCFMDFSKMSDFC